MPTSGSKAWIFSTKRNLSLLHVEEGEKLHRYLNAVLAKGSFSSKHTFKKESVDLPDSFESQFDRRKVNFKTGIRSPIN